MSILHFLAKQQGSEILAVECPSGWNYYNDNCYYVSTIPKSQPDARDDCQSFGGDLVSVDDDAEMNFITSISYVCFDFSHILY